ncbi:MAG TPA: hypothetical protein P5137_03755 [Candidatus Brocadiia bacterium]|nr:hypothetical protein [Candidatus Brocadiia bacterium]
MRSEELLELFRQGGRRCLVVGGAENGVAAGLDLEGRLFAWRKGEVLHRVNPDAFAQQSHAGQYFNPGGDGFWPAPEGSRFGYLYGAGAWRVPPSLTGARYRVMEQSPDFARIRAELDLINASGRGLAVAFERAVAATVTPMGLRMVVADSIEYLGPGELSENEVRLAPWTLAQFDTSPGMEVVFPACPAEAVRDYYEPSGNLRRLEEGFWHTKTEGGQKYQIGLAESVPWIELRVPSRKMRVMRRASPLAPGERHIDIADQAPTAEPLDFGARYSVYNDGGAFMEIEAVGPFCAPLRAGARLAHRVTTEFSFG